MSTNYWQTNDHSLGESYVDSNQFPQMLLVEEGYVDLPYADSSASHYATIGIGVNLVGNPNYMALVLQQLGVFNATQTVSQQQALVTQFEGIIADPKNSITPLAGRIGPPPPYSDSEKALQTVIIGDRSRFPAPPTGLYSKSS